MTDLAPAEARTLDAVSGAELVSTPAPMRFTTGVAVARAGATGETNRALSLERREALASKHYHETVSVVEKARRKERDPHWRDRAACLGIDTDTFFPLATDDAGVASAKSLYGGCPVRGECLSFANASYEDHGIWGGLTSGERRSILRSAYRPRQTGTAA